MRNYYKEIHEYLERLIQNIIITDKKGIKTNGGILSITDMFILKSLENQKEKKMSDIMEELSIDRNSFVTIINKLQNMQFIKKDKDGEDKRVQVIQLTEKGQAALDEIIDMEKEILFSLLKDFTFNEEKAVLKFLFTLDQLNKEKNKNVITKLRCPPPL